MAHGVSPRVRVPHPQARGGGASGYAPADGPVHGLQTVGTDPFVGSDALVGGLGPSAGLRFPPGAVRRGRGPGRLAPPCHRRSGTSKCGACDPAGPGRPPLQWSTPKALEWVTGWQCGMPPCTSKSALDRCSAQQALHRAMRLWCGVHQHNGGEGLHCLPLPNGGAGDVAGFLRRDPQDRELLEHGLLVLYRPL